MQFIRAGIRAKRLSRISVEKSLAGPFTTPVAGVAIIYNNITIVIYNCKINYECFNSQLRTYAKCFYN